MPRLEAVLILMPVKLAHLPAMPCRLERGGGRRVGAPHDPQPRVQGPLEGTHDRQPQVQGARTAGGEEVQGSVGKV